MAVQVCPTYGMGKVLVATDGAESSRSAVEEAIQVAKACSSKLIAISVVRSNLEYEINLPQIVAEEEKEARTYLESVKRRASAEGLDCQIVVRSGEEPFPEIVEEAETNDVDMIVMGTRHRTGIRRVLLGSITRYVTGHAPCNVLIVPPGSKINYENILIATDGSKHSLAAAFQAISLAKKCGSSLTIVSVASAAAEIPSSEENVKHITEIAQGEGLKTNGMVVQGNPYEVILEISKQKSADLIVMGSHGKTGLMNLLMGSVTDRVISQEESPVLVVRDLHKDRFSFLEE